MCYEVCKCVLPKVKRKTQKPFCFFPFYSSLISPPHSPTLLLTHYLSHPPLFSHFLSFLPTAATPLSLSLSHAPFSFSFLASVYFLSTVIPLVSLFFFPLDSRFPSCRDPNCFVYYDDLVIGLPDRVSFFF